MKHLLTAIFIFSFLNSAIPQDEFAPDNSLLHLKNEILNSPVELEFPSDFKMKKSPVRAMIYSAVLPGAGQFYNESYWKIPLIAAAGGYFMYGIINNNNKANDFGEQYRQSQTQVNPAGDPILRATRDFYFDQRDDFIIYFSLLYIANLVDAYVDAHLYDFEVNESNRIKINPGYGRLNFSFNF